MLVQDRRRRSYSDVLLSFFCSVVSVPKFFIDSATLLPITAVIPANPKPEPTLLRVRMAVADGTKDTLSWAQTSATAAALRDTVVIQQSTAVLVQAAPRERSTGLLWVFERHHGVIPERVRRHAMAAVGCCCCIFEVTLSYGYYTQILLQLFWNKASS